VRRALAIVLAVTAGCGGSSTENSRLTLPPGFKDELVASLEQATVLGALPDGRILLGNQPGVVRMLDPSGRLRPKPVLDLTRRVCTERERGLSGLAVDPDFETTRHVYLYYTLKKLGNCDVVSSRGPVNRLSRFTMSEDATLRAGSEKVLLDNIPSFGATHNAGDSKFAKDGYLYVGVGDGGRDYARRTTTSQENQAARDHNVLLGKILRLTKDGRPAPGNPYTGPDSVRCATIGVAPRGTFCRETYAWGLRNPWRLAFDPNASDVRFYINDVGENAWEEIDVGERGADYGWQLREGPCPMDGRVRCGPGKPSMTEPLFSYAHTGSCRSITGGAFVPRGAGPRTLDGAYLFGDFLCGTIWILRGDRAEDARRETFASGLPLGIVTMEFLGSDLYYVNYLRGELHRIRYSGRS
jgi:glucose/arabinose dehydrogenase